jgi:hypothetical protein
MCKLIVVDSLGCPPIYKENFAEILVECFTQKKITLKLRVHVGIEYMLGSFSVNKSNSYIIFFFL